MDNYIKINGKKIKLSDETAKELQEKLSDKTTELPKSWKELEEIEGWWIGAKCELKETTWAFNTYDSNKDLWTTRELAEAALAMSQLSQLRDRYNGGWKPLYDSNVYIPYDVICQSINGLNCLRSSGPEFLTFKNRELRDEFFKNFRDLIETAKPLL